VTGLYSTAFPAATPWGRHSQGSTEGSLFLLNPGKCRRSSREKPFS